MLPARAGGGENIRNRAKAASGMESPFFMPQSRRPEDAGATDTVAEESVTCLTVFLCPWSRNSTTIRPTAMSDDRLLFPIADIRSVRNQGNRRAAYGQKRSVRAMHKTN